MDRSGVLSEHRDPEVFADGVTIDNPILRIEPDGSLGRSLSLLDGLKSREGACPFRPPVESHPGKADPLHINSIEWVQRPGADFRDGGSARPLMLLCMRHQDCVYLVDWETGDVVWDWGRGELDGPHDATLLANGNVLIFDNGMVRGWSRVVEVDRHSNEIVWEYPGATGEPFFTRGRGGSQRLPNGNTLIAESNEGRAFEVSQSGKIVWEFFNPRYREGHRTAIVRMRHYDADFIGSLLDDPR